MWTKVNISSEYIFFDVSPTASCAGRAPPQSPLPPSPHQNPPSSPPTAALPQSRCITRGEKTCWSPLEVSRRIFPLRCCFNGKYFLSSFRLQSCHWLAQFQILTQIIFAQLEKQSALPKNGFSRISERFEKLTIFFYFASRKKPRTTKYTNMLKSLQKSDIKPGTGAKRNVHLVSLALADRYLQYLVKTISVVVKCLALNVKRNAFSENFQRILKPVFRLLIGKTKNQVKKLVFQIVYNVWNINFKRQRLHICISKIAYLFLYYAIFLFERLLV